MLTIKLKPNEGAKNSAAKGKPKAAKENEPMVRIANRKQVRRTLGRHARDEEEEDEEVEERPRSLIRGRRQASSRKVREEEEEEAPPRRGRMGRGMGRLPKEYDFETLVFSLEDFDPEGKNKYSTLPPNFREAMARLSWAIQELDEDTQEAIADAWEEVTPPEE